MATLKELDSWGVMDALDSYGTLDQLDNLTLHSAVSSTNIAVTTLTELQRVLHFAASVTGAASVVAVVTHIRQVGSSVNIAVTVTADGVIVHQASASVNASISTTAIANFIAAEASVDFGLLPPLRTK